MDGWCLISSFGDEGGPDDGISSTHYLKLLVKASIWAMRLAYSIVILHLRNFLKNNEIFSKPKKLEVEDNDGKKKRIH